MLAFDTLQYSKNLAAGGFTTEQAETLAREQTALLEDQLATKADIKDVRGEIAAVRRDLDGTEERLKAEFKADLAEVRSELKEEIAEVRGEIAGVRHELKEEINSVRSELKEDIAAVRTDLSREIGEATNRMMKWTMTLIMGQAAIIIATVAALIKFL